MSEIKMNPADPEFPELATDPQILDDVEDLVTDPEFPEAFGQALSSVREVLGRDGLLEGLLSAVKVITGGNVDKNDPVVEISLTYLALASVVLPRSVAAAMTPLDARISRIETLAKVLETLTREGPSGTLARISVDHLEAAKLHAKSEKLCYLNLRALEQMQDRVAQQLNNQSEILSQVNDRIRRLGMGIIATEKELLKGNRK